MTFYRCNLPHWFPNGKALFITWNLHASIRDRHYLARPEIAQIIVDALRYAQTQLHLNELHAWVIMSNHVHILIDPHAPLPRITKSIKNFSAREANQILHLTGTPFWQNESYDHWVRDRAEFDRIADYIELNPVTAGLVGRPEDWRWSSASVGREAYTTKESRAR